MKKLFLAAFLLLCLSASFHTANALELPNAVDLQTKVVGTVNEPDGHQVNLSFIGNTNSDSIAKWDLMISCSKDVQVNTVPGIECNESFVMGSSNNNGNVLNKEFWFRNYSSKSQKVELTLRGLNASGVIVGSDSETLSIPPTSKGPKTWSHVTVVSPNGGETLEAGKKIKIKWKTKSDYSFNFKLSSRVEIFLMQDRVVKQIYNLKNSGSAQIMIPETMPAGSNYKIMAIVYSTTGAEGTAMSDESDETFSITPMVPEPKLKYLQAKAANKNEFYSSENGIVLYGENLDAKAKVYMVVKGVKYYLTTSKPMGGSVEVKAVFTKVIPDGKYKIYAEREGKVSSAIKVKYRNTSAI